MANSNGIATIMVRVSSTEGFKNQNLLIQDFKHLQKHEVIPFKKSSDLHNRNQLNKYAYYTVFCWCTKRTRLSLFFFCFCFFVRISDCTISIKDKEYSFTNKRKRSRRGTVDVWWLYNDGGS